MRPRRCRQLLLIVLWFFTIAFSLCAEEPGANPGFVLVPTEQWDLLQDRLLQLQSLPTFTVPSLIELNKSWSSYDQSTMLYVESLKAENENLNATVQTLETLYQDSQRKLKTTEHTVKVWKTIGYVSLGISVGSLIVLTATMLGNK